MNGRLLYERDDQKGGKLIIHEEEYYNLAKNIKSEYKPLKLKTLEEEDARIMTRELLNYIPINELFKSNISTKTTNITKEPKKDKIEVEERLQAYKEEIIDMFKSKKND